MLSRQEEGEMHKLIQFNLFIVKLVKLNKINLFDQLLFSVVFSDHVQKNDNTNIKQTNNNSSVRLDFESFSRGIEDT